MGKPDQKVTAIKRNEGETVIETVTADDLSDWWKYNRRSQAVHWHKVPACRKGAGHDYATCILTPGHPGPHYGNGHDEWGPKGPFQWPNKKGGD